MIKQNPKHTHGALIAPAYPDSIPEECKWLGGEGHGVWFLISKPEFLAENEYRIIRYSDKGNLDCDRIFILDSDEDFFIDKDFEFAYISHCQKCTVLQSGNFFKFKFLRTFESN